MRGASDALTTPLLPSLCSCTVERPGEMRLGEALAPGFTGGAHSPPCSGSPSLYGAAPTEDSLRTCWLTRRKKRITRMRSCARADAAQRGRSVPWEIMQGLVSGPRSEHGRREQGADRQQPAHMLRPEQKRERTMLMAQHVGWC